MAADDLLPTELDFYSPDAFGLDEAHAVAKFLGKTAAQAEKMFDDNFLFYLEDLSVMRAPAFRYYVKPALRSLLNQQTNSNSDAISCFAGVLENQLRNDPFALQPISELLIGAIQTILRDFQRFDCNPEIYGDVPHRFRRILERLQE